MVTAVSAGLVSISAFMLDFYRDIRVVLLIGRRQCSVLVSGPCYFINKVRILPLKKSTHFAELKMCCVVIDLFVMTSLSFVKFVKITFLQNILLKKNEPTRWTISGLQSRDFKQAGHRVTPSCFFTRPVVWLSLSSALQGKRGNVLNESRHGCAPCEHWHLTAEGHFPPTDLCCRNIKYDTWLLCRL